jgi:phage gp36-like protein
MATVTQYAVPADLDSGINPTALIGVANQAKLDAIDQSSRLIDSFLRAQFTLPLTQVGGDVKRAAINIAIYYVMVGRGYNPDAGADPGIRQRYDDEIAWLKMVSAGKAIPDITDSSEGSAEGRPGAQPQVYSSSQRGYSSRGDPNGKRFPFQGD